MKQGARKIFPFVKVIAELCNNVYREYPYFYDGSSAEYAEYLQSYAQTANGIVCIAYDGEAPHRLGGWKTHGRK